MDAHAARPLVVAGLLLSFSLIQAAFAQPEPPSTETPADQAPAAMPGVPADFARDLSALWELVALDAEGGSPVVVAHRRQLAEIVGQYRSQWLSKATPFFAQIVPHGVPGTVVYPFGGVDMTSVFAVFPEATDITTLSLEPAGEAAAMFGGTGEDLAHRLELVRKEFAYLFRVAFSRSDHLTELTEEDVPGPVIFSLLAMSIHGYRPVALRYFRLTREGKIRYLTEPERQAAVAAHDSHAFDDSEIVFQRASGGPRLVHRHLFADLSDKRYDVDPSVMAFLGAKGPVVAITKAASYLLWEKSFSRIRNYLLEHMTWMVSDETGIPPDAAREAGFEQVTYGLFSAPIMKANRRVAQELKDLWKSQPRRPAPFRFGYPNHGSGDNHLMITRPGAGGSGTEPDEDE